MRDWIINLLALWGLALMTMGLWLMWQPLGIMGAGVALLLLALALARAHESNRRNPRE